MEQFSFYPEAWFNGEAPANYDHRADWDFDDPNQDRTRSLSAETSRRKVNPTSYRPRALTPGDPSRVLSVFATLRRLNWTHAAT